MRILIVATRRNVKAGIGLACLLLLPTAVPAAASDPPWLPQRSNNPFLVVFGLPAYEPVATGHAGQWRSRLALDVSNHADADSLPGETAEVDGESYRLTLSARYSPAERLTLGIDVPFIRHSGGWLDAPIENWHDLWGLSNSKRTGPRGQLRFHYAGSDDASFDLDSPVGGMGDIQLFAAMRLGTRFGLRAGIELPTGDADRLLGSGAVDAWLEASASAASAFGHDRLRLSAAGGLLLPGRGDLLPQMQRDTVTFGSLAAGWQATDRLTILAQIHAQSAYFDSGTDLLGGDSLQLALGGRYTLSDHKVALSFALVEDVFDNATTDVALHVSASTRLGTSP